MSQMASLLTSILTCYNVQMDNFKKVHAFYSKFIETHEEVLYEELLDYVASAGLTGMPSMPWRGAPRAGGAPHRVLEKS